MAARRPLIVVCGTTNRGKLDAARAAFSAAFAPRGAPAVDVRGVPAASGVSDQPVGDAETRRGAFARAAGAAAAAAGAGADGAVDFAVGMEGGVVEDGVVLPGARAPTPDLVCFAWMAVLHVPSSRWGWARTASFSLPPRVAALVRGGVELGEADDRVFGRRDSKLGEGAVGLLTHGGVGRPAYYAHALRLALARFLHDGPGSELHLGRAPRGGGGGEGGGGNGEGGGGSGEGAHLWGLYDDAGGAADGGEAGGGGRAT